METSNADLRFKTTLNCGGCVSKVKPDLDNAPGIRHWNVDTDNTDKVLTVSPKGITSEEVIAIIKSKGFHAEPMV